MSLTRWRQIRKIIKLNDNDKALKKMEEGYNPAYKYDFIFRCVVDNINEITHQADLDQYGNETTFGFMGYGETGTSFVSRIIGKPGISRGGQLVLISDAGMNRPRAYVHRHKCHVRPVGFTKEGPNEV